MNYRFKINTLFTLKWGNKLGTIHDKKSQKIRIAIICWFSVNICSDNKKNTKFSKRFSVKNQRLLPRLYLPFSY